MFPYALYNVLIPLSGSKHKNIKKHHRFRRKDTHTKIQVGTYLYTLLAFLIDFPDFTASTAWFSEVRVHVKGFMLPEIERAI